MHQSKAAVAEEIVCVEVLDRPEIREMLLVLASSLRLGND